MRVAVACVLVLLWGSDSAWEVYGQGTIRFNNLHRTDGLVLLSFPSWSLFPLDRDLNFMLLAGSDPANLKPVHTWLLGDGTARGINVGPGRFADPSGSVFSIPGVPAGTAAAVLVLAWSGDYSDYYAADGAGEGHGSSPGLTMQLGSAAAPPPGLLGLSEFRVSFWRDPLVPLELGINLTNGLPRLRISGSVGSFYLLESAADLSGATQWRSLGGQATIVLLSNPQFITDTSAVGMPQRFYRTAAPVVPPPNLVWIRPGTFVMGSPTNEVDRNLNEGPPTEVTLTRGFWIGRYEVTQVEFQTVMGVIPSLNISDANSPVDQVSWIDATNYCAKLAERERRQGRLPAGYAYRLPTEIEWEYAARAGTASRFSLGDDAGYTNLANYAWYAANSGHHVHPVGQKLPNPWGLYDMHGNVAEWCLDWSVPYPGGSVTDPKDLGVGSGRAVRGGDYNSAGGLCRSASRYFIMQETWAYGFGFRVVLAPTQP